MPAHTPLAPSKRNFELGSALLAFVFAFAPQLASADPTALAPAPAATAPRCKAVSGRYSAFPRPASVCLSPVGFCTAGALSGRLHGSYSFTMKRALPAGEPSAPGATFYTGESLMTVEQGSLVGTDTGTVDLNPFGTGRQAALITLTSGSEGLEGASGYLSLVGALNFSTGEVRGRYEGELCLPAPHPGGDSDAPDEDRSDVED